MLERDDICGLEDDSNKICIVIPVLNEYGNIHNIFLCISEQMKSESFEIIFVDDGSTDNTLSLLKELSYEYKYVNYISFSRNFGHQNALKAGFDAANGACVITIDGDLQHPVDLIPKMIDLWRNGADIVFTRRQDTQDTSVFKRLTSYIYYKIFKVCADISIEPNTADFRLMDKSVVDICKHTQEDSLFWRGYIPWLGFRHEFINYTPNARADGQSKYNFKKMIKLAWTGISSFSLLPLRFSWILGGIGITISFIYGLYVVFQYFNGAAIQGWSSLMVTLLFFGSSILVALGILGEFIGKIYIGIKKRPYYIVRESNYKKNSI